jgi:hypothetical protein
MKRIPRMQPESELQPPIWPVGATRVATGPLDFHLAELESYGLGIVVRDLRLRGAPIPEPLRRLYCLSCGRAVAHEPPVPGWWICAQSCNRAGEEMMGDFASGSGEPESAQ